MRVGVGEADACTQRVPSRNFRIIEHFFAAEFAAIIDD